MKKHEHISFEKANKDFAANFGCTDCKISNPDVSGGDSNGSGKGAAIISGVTVSIAVIVFIAIRFF